MGWRLELLDLVFRVRVGFLVFSFYKVETCLVFFKVRFGLGGFGIFSCDEGKRVFIFGF